MQFDQLIIIGVGGTGTHLLEPLVRLLGYHKNQTKNVMIIDGDKYEEKNRIRQLFSKSYVGKNKAEASAERVAFEGFTVTPVQGYINKIDFCDVILDSIPDVAKKNLLVITSVDNHATRKDIITALDDRNQQNFVLISPGNDFDMGQVIVYAKKDGKNLTCHPFENFPDLKEPKDRIPGGCAEQAPSTPQLITANASAALGCLLIVSAMLEGNPWYDQVHFDCKKMKLVPNGDPILSEVPAPDPALAPMAAGEGIEVPPKPETVVSTQETVETVEMVIEAKKDVAVPEVRQEASATN